MFDVAIIGGTGLTALKNLEIKQRKVTRTPFGEPSAPFVIGELCNQDVIFLARHGHGHNIPPHMVNYRANIWALKEMGVKKVISVAAVGGIKSNMRPGQLAFPDQIIDYTWSRQHTFFERDLSQVVHIDFTEPYCSDLRDILVKSSKQLSFDSVVSSCVYGATQGPRLETAAEINRMERDGCDIVGMTGMPEAALAREAGIGYAHCAVISNHAAGRSESEISMEDIEKNLVDGMNDVRQLLETAIPMLF